jgi:hypothetical protein
MIGWCIPTIPSRQDMLEECVRSLPMTGRSYIHHSSPSCGEGWQRAGDRAFRENAEYIALLGDDVLWRGGFLDAIEALKQRIMPAPLLLNADDSPSTATPYMQAPTIGAEVANVPFPFLNRELWEAVQPIPPFNHWCDVWITERCRAAGYTPRLREWTLVHRVISDEVPGEYDRYLEWKARHE